MPQAIKPRRLASSRSLGLVIPAAAMAVEDRQQHSAERKGEHLRARAERRHPHEQAQGEDDSQGPAKPV